MRRTSATHPLRIAVVAAGPEFGRIGITFCPGKFDQQVMTGPWDRDLAADLDKIREWGAHAVVTLVESQELKLLRVENLGHEVMLRNMRWFHLPIVDVDIPGARFEAEWKSAGAELCWMLRQKSDILVHCRGGMGRAGTIAARLLVELSMAPASAIAAVRAVRPRAIETRQQEQYVLGFLGLAGKQ